MNLLPENSKVSHRGDFLVLVFIVLTILIAATAYPFTVLGMREAISGSGLFYKIGGFAIIFLGFVPILLWLYFLYWSFFIST